MKKFKFTLQTLFDVKQTLKDKLQADFAAAEAAYQAAVDKLTSLVRTYEEELDIFEEKSREGITAHELTSAAAYHEDLRERIRRAEIEAARTLKIANEKREELVTVYKEIKVLEKLYEKQRAEYLKELEKDEAKALDSILSFQQIEDKDDDEATEVNV
jgi:flagellar export protein FliJ